MKATVAFIALAACASAPQDEGEPKAWAVRGLLKTMAGPDVEGVLVIRGGRIESIGKDVPADARLVEGKVVTPGFIDAQTYLGLWEVDQVPQTRDEHEASDPVTPNAWVGDAINPGSALIPVTRMNGVTTVVVSPSERNVISGVSALVDLDGRLVSDMLVVPRLALLVNFGEDPTKQWRESKKVVTRMGLAAVVREAFTKAQAYAAKKEKGEHAYDARMEALLPALRGDLPVIARAHRLDDLWTAIRIAEEFKLKLILSHATEGWKIAGEIAKRKIPVLVGPINTQPDSMETQGATYENADILHRAGVRIAMQTNDAHNVRNLPFMAGIAAAYGLPADEALRAITVNPAEIFGLSDLGVLKPGARANVAVFDGDPLQPRTKVLALFIAGRRIELRSRQTELAERYGWKP